MYEWKQITLIHKNGKKRTKDIHTVNVSKNIMKLKELNVYKDNHAGKITGSGNTQSLKRRAR